MITSVIGKIFLDAYNEKNGTEYDAKKFFAEVFYPLFFDKEKYMMSPGNNPIENPKISWEKMIKGNIPYETKEKRKERYDKLLEKIKCGRPSTENAIGYASSDIMSTTSGQTSNILIEENIEDIYFSWIGAAMGIGVEGGLSILFFDKRILLDIFEGWQYYREMLDNTPYLKGNQIATWNACWIVHKYSQHTFDTINPLKNLDIMRPATGKYSGCFEIGLTSWIKVIFFISQKYQELRIMGYVYSLGQTNKTIGFIPFLLDEIRRPRDFYKKIFGTSGMNAETLYGYDTDKLLLCCQKGSIGLKAIEPINIEQYMNGKKGKLPEIPKYDEKNEEKLISFRTYQIWILAMLNNQDFWDKSLALAETIRKYETSDKALSKKRANAVSAILESTNKKTFIESLTAIVGEAENKDQVIAIASEVNTMPTDNVPYFLTLVRFQYASIK